MDRIIAWPGQSSIRIYGDRSGAWLDCPGAFTGRVSRADAAKVIWAMRKAMRKIQEARRA